MAENTQVTAVRFLKSAVKPRDYPPTFWPEVAIVGRSNVGKSSLINGLVNRKRLARVSNTPGRTQLLNFFEVDVRNRGTFTLCDLPGYGYARVPLSVKAAWGPMVGRYLTERDSLKAVLLLIDARRTPGEPEIEVLQAALNTGRAVLPVVTKIDKLKRSQRRPAIQGIAEALGLERRQIMPWSALSGEGMKPLWNRMMSLAGLDRPPVEPGAEDPESAPEEG